VTSADAVFVFRTPSYRLPWYVSARRTVRSRHVSVYDKVLPSTLKSATAHPVFGFVWSFTKASSPDCASPLAMARVSGSAQNF
jgi:hypothetical protein